MSPDYCREESGLSDFETRIVLSNVEVIVFPDYCREESGLSDFEARIVVSPDYCQD